MTDLSGLKPDPRNARRRTDRSASLIAESLQRFGAARSIVIDEDGRILAGNGTVEGAKAAGISKVRIIETDGDELVAVRRSGLTEEQKVGLALADNRTSDLSEWDADMLQQLSQEQDLAPWFDADDLAALLGETEQVEAEGLTDPDDVPEPPAEPVTKPGDIWLLGKHRVMCGDSTSLDEVERLMVLTKADLCLTSFPYGVGLDYGIYVDTFENCRQLLREVAPVIWSVLRDGGFCVTNFADIVSAREINKTATPSEYPMALEYWPAFTNAGFLLHTRRVWAKPHARVSAPWTANSSRAACDWEHVWTWLKPGVHLNERRALSFYGVIDSTKLDGVDVGKDTHPAAFPVGIAAAFVQIYSNNRESVFEPFCGTGTTVIACKAAGRKCYGMELSPAYCDVIVKRWQQFTGKTATLEATGEPFPSDD